MKSIAIILLFLNTCLVWAQPKPITKWNNVSYSSYKIKPILTDSVVAFMWQNKLYTYVKSTQQTLLSNTANSSSIGYQTVYTKDGYYYVRAETGDNPTYDSTYFYSYRNLTAYNLGICGMGKGYSRFLYQLEARDTNYYLVQTSNQAYKIFQLAGASTRDLDINLNTYNVTEFYAKQDTFIYIINFTEGSTLKIAVRCKIGTTTRTLFEHYADSFSVNYLYTSSDKAYFLVGKKRDYQYSYYESSYQTLDAVPSSFIPDKRPTERMKDKTLRKINFDKQRVERFDSTGTNLLFYTNFPRNLFVKDQYRREVANGNVWVLTTNDYGTETCVLTESDSFVNIDVAPGMYSSFKEYNDNYPDLIIPGDTAFALLRNLDVNHRFVYRMTGHSYLPYEPILDLGKDTSTNIILFFKAWDRQIYWLTYDASLSELRLYTAPYEQPAIEVPVPNFGFDKQEWHRQLGFGKLWPDDPQINTGGIDLVDSGEVIVSAFTNANTQRSLSMHGHLMSYQDQFKHRLKAGQFTARLKSNGQVAWITSYGKVHDFYDRNFHQVIDKNGDIYVTGQAGDIAIFGNDTLRVTRGAINFLVKLNGKTGELLWHKMLFKGQYSNTANVESLVIDSFNNLYLAIVYKDFEIQILGTSLSNQQVSPANALVKLNAQGDLVWAFNIITPFTKNYGMTRAMLINHALQKIVVIQSIGYYNWWSSCKYNSWYSYVQSIDMSSGKISWTKLYESDDLHSTTALTLNKQGDIMLAGYFRGTIKLDDYTYTSKSGQFCNQFQPFFTVLNPINGEVLFAQTSETDLFYLFEMKTAPNGEIWAVGAKETSKNRYSLSVVAVNEFGVITQERNFRKSASPFDFGFFPSLAVNDKHVVFADAVQYDLDTFKYCFDYEEQLSVVKLAIDDIPSISPSPSKAKIRFTNYQIMVYPNPVEDQLMLITDKPDEITDIHVIDITGREFKLTYSKQATYHTVNVEALPAGVYVLRINGNKGAQSVKFVKSE